MICLEGDIDTYALVDSLLECIYVNRYRGDYMAMY